MLRIKEQETRLTLHELDDDDEILWWVLGENNTGCGDGHRTGRHVHLFIYTRVY